MRASILWLMALPGLAAGLGERIDSLLRSGGAAGPAFWGIHVVDAVTGESLYERNADQLFVPASNVKLFTTALALARLGPEFRFQTVVRTEAQPDQAGRLTGNLWLYGGGDPTLSGRDYPYRKRATAGDPLRGIEELADRVAAQGVHRIEGDIIGDDSLYPWEPYPPGWTQGDSLWDYGAPVSALTLNDNTIWLTVRPGTRAGVPAILSLRPAVEYYVVHNQVQTVERPGGRVVIERVPGARELRVSGQIALSDPGQTYALALDDPARYAAAALAEALVRRGIFIRGRPRAWHASTPDAGVQPPVELGRRLSPALTEILRVINKESQNLHAELVLRAVAQVCSGSGTRRAGLEEMRRFLGEVGLPEGVCRLEDGSGLSRRNLVTPRAVTQLLVFMYNGPYRDIWTGLLPVGGEDGTLQDRFRNVPEGRSIRAKTGTLASSSALSGYAETPRGQVLAFSILVNNHAADTSEVRGLIDRISIVIAQGG
jgi:D-alanyl-D-alanine carboxypeptidase/D-alanyl-D-alanine-endopeptidase (penicillin-binding protein 4)